MKNTFLSLRSHSWKMIEETLPVWILSLFVVCISCKTSGPENVKEEEVDRIMTGLVNETKQQRNVYLTAGDKTYIVGTQDGNFPDLGGHTPGEMGGLWNQMIKLMDGFWVEVSGNSTKSILLENAESYTSLPYGSLFRYPLVLDSIKISRFQFCPQGQNSISVTYSIENLSHKSCEMDFKFIARTDIRPVWSSDWMGINDGEDTVSWEEAQSVYQAKDVMSNWNVVWGSTTAPSKHSMKTRSVKGEREKNRVID